jgi:3-deoxy-7-phosphoheptulonate synthase
MKDKLLDSPESFLKRIPLSDSGKRKIDGYRQDILAILQGRDPRILLICGPCSIHNIDAGLEYARRLKTLSEQVKDRFYIIMRAYFEKPRTLFGWKGLLYDPHQNSSYDIIEGITQTRRFLLALADYGIPSASEFLDPLAANYIADLIAWGSIGARTVQSPIHRQLASSLPMPIGFKNTTDGNIAAAISAAQVAKEGHTFLNANEQGQIVIRQSNGNIFPHIVLRGSDTEENYHINTIEKAASLMKLAGLLPAIVIDASHGNCNKNYKAQQQVFKTVLDNIRSSHLPIRGIMLESFLLENTQEELYQLQLHTKEEIAFGASKTDPCICWQSTEALIKEGACI